MISEEIEDERAFIEIKQELEYDNKYNGPKSFSVSSELLIDFIYKFVFFLKKIVISPFV